MNISAARLLSSAFAVLLVAGCSQLDTGKTDADGTAFVTHILEDQKGSWKPDKLAAVVNKSVTEKDVQKATDLYATVIGSLTSFEVPKSKNARTSVNIGTSEKPNYTATYASKLVCEKGPATFAAAVSRYGTQWQLDSFDIDSENIRKTVNDKAALATTEAKALLHNALDNWDSKVIEQSASVKLTADLKKNPLLLPGLFKASSIALGKVKKYPELKIQGMSEIDGAEVVKLVLPQVEFEKGKADVFCGMTKEDGKWKVCGFRIQGGNRPAVK
ncbi:hypothetical protein BH11CYA1_BH11CYA1_10090 [soil metagenome]